MAHPRATLTYPTTIDPYVDAERIHEACRGMGTKEDVITEIVGHRSLSQRLAIRQAYQKKYQKDLMKLFASELTGDYESLVKGLFKTPVEILARQIYKSLKGIGSSHHTLTYILCCCNKLELHMVKKAYARLLQEEGHPDDRTRSLDSDVKKHTKGHYELLMEEVLRADRCDDSAEDLELARKAATVHGVVDKNLVISDVQRIHTALESVDKGGSQCTKSKTKIDPTPIITILTKRSKLHVRAIWDEYKKTHGINLVKAIAARISEPLRTALNTLIMAQVDLRLLLVCQLYEVMVGLGTDESALIRIICLHAEHDLRDLVDDYQKYFGKPLLEAIKSDTSGDFRKLLVLLVGG